MTSAMAEAPWLEPKWLEQPWKSNVAFSITRHSCVEGWFGKKAIAGGGGTKDKDEEADAKLVKVA